MSDAHRIAGRALEAAVEAGAEEAEAFLGEGTGREIRVYAGEVESLSESVERGVGVRAWIDGRVGYAYGTDLSDEGLARVGAAAVEAAAVADPDPNAAAPEAPATDPGAAPGIDVGSLLDPSIRETTTKAKVELALAAERAALAAERVESIEQAAYAEEETTVAIASSSGRAGAYEASVCYAYVQALAGGGDDVQTGLGFEVGRGPASLDPEAIGGEAAERATALLGASKPASRSCPVVLDPTVAASFVGVLGGGLCADAVQRGRSPFAGRLGEEVAAPALRLADDGLHPDGLATAPFDGEGTPRARTPLIGDGRLLAYLHDSYTARREGAASTGNGSRSGYRSAPTVSSSNLVVAEGEAGLEELLAQAEGGILVTDVAGLHSGVNPVSGTFSVGASGLVIEGGEPARPASEFTIASDLISMLREVRATASEARWVRSGGSVLTPAILIGEMAIAGGPAGA